MPKNQKLHERKSEIRRFGDYPSRLGLWFIIWDGAVAFIEIVRGLFIVTICQIAKFSLGGDEVKFGRIIYGSLFVGIIASCIWLPLRYRFDHVRGTGFDMLVSYDWLWSNYGTVAFDRLIITWLAMFGLAAVISGIATLIEFNSDKQ